MNKKDMDPRAKEMLENEIKLLNALLPLLKDGKVEQGVELIKTHYIGSLQQGPWIDKLVKDSGNTDILLNMTKFVGNNIFDKRMASFTFMGPPESPYANQEFVVEMDIVDDYPDIPIQCYIVNKQIYHLNVE